MSCYRIMKPFITNLKLVINKYLCCLHESFPGFDPSSNDGMLNEKRISIFPHKIVIQSGLHFYTCY